MVSLGHRWDDRERDRYVLPRFARRCLCRGSTAATATRHFELVSVAHVVRPASSPTDDRPSRVVLVESDGQEEIDDDEEVDPRRPIGWLDELHLIAAEQARCTTRESSAELDHGQQCLVHLPSSKSARGHLHSESQSVERSTIRTRSRRDPSRRPTRHQRNNGKSIDRSVEEPHAHTHSPP